MTNSNDDYIFTYNDTNRHGLLSGMISALFFIGSCICPFLGDITYWLFALVLAFIGACCGSYGIWQAKFNSKNKIPRKLCKLATFLNVLYLAGMVALLIVMLITLSVVGCC
jgi:hypothetical protein